MKITGYESENGNVTAITVTDETRGFYDKRFVPERPHGEWVKRTIGYLSTHECSNCDFNGDWLWKFCPNCGAKMTGER